MPDRHFSVSVHDVAPATWSRCGPLLELAARYATPATLLIVPRYHTGVGIDQDASFAAQIRSQLAGGGDAVLHGYCHRDDGPAPRTPRAWFRRRLCTDAEGEFDAIDERDARRRLVDGLRRLERIGVRPTGFVPPAWLLGPGARTAISQLGFEYTCTRDWLIRLPDGTRHRAPSLVWSTRAAWRRSIAGTWNAVRLSLEERAPLLRVALHPSDADHPEVLNRWDRILRGLATDRHPTLESRWLSARP